MTDQTNSEPLPTIDPAQFAMLQLAECGHTPPEPTVTICGVDGEPDQVITLKAHRELQREAHRRVIQSLRHIVDRLAMLAETIAGLESRREFLQARQTEMIQLANTIANHIS